MKLTIKQIRIGLGMNQAEIARFLNISEGAYRDKERGDTRFYFDEVKKICDKANVDMNSVKA